MNIYYISIKKKTVNEKASEATGVGASASVSACLQPLHILVLPPNSHTPITKAKVLPFWSPHASQACIAILVYFLPCPLQPNYFQFSSVAQSCPTLCDPMNCSTPGLPVHHQLLEFTETQVHQVSDAIQPSHPLSSPSPPAPNPSQHQGLFQ